MQSGYERSLGWCLRHKAITFGMFLASVGLSAWLFVIVPKDFLPSEDTGRIFAYTEGTPATSFDEMVHNQTKAMEIVRADPAIDQVMMSVGAGGSRTTSYNFV